MTERSHAERLELFESGRASAIVAARTMAKRRPGLAELRDELEAAALVGLWMATATYDAGRAAFATHAAIRVRGEMLDWIRQICPLTRRQAREGSIRLVSLQEPTEDGRPLLAHLPGVQDPEPWVDDFDRLLRGLPFRSREVLRLYHVEDLTMREIGARLGLSESRVSQVHSDALMYLRRHRSTRASA
jgi:RNA polymerase sigma factor (sigma-70 family)